MAARLTDRQRAFIFHYLSNGFNGTKAAIAAGYSANSATEIAYENLRKPHIAAAIDEHMQSLHMRSDEVLARLSMMARGDLGEFMATDDGKSFRLPTAQSIAKHPKSFLLRKFKITEKTDGSKTTEIELHDPQAALLALGKHHGILSERVEIDDWTSELRKAGLSTDEITEVGREFSDIIEKALTRRMAIARPGRDD